MKKIHLQKAFDHLRISGFCICQFLMLPFKTYTQNGHTELEQLTTIAFANSGTEDPENPEDPVYKPFGLWDWIISLTD